MRNYAQTHTHRHTDTHTHTHTHMHTYSHSCSEDIYFNQLCLLLIVGVLGITSRPFPIIFFYMKLA